MCVNYSHSKMDIAEQHPLPTPPSNPPDSSDREIHPSDPAQLQGKRDPLAGSPDEFHPAVLDPFTSELPDELLSSSALSSPLAPPVRSIDDPQPDSLIDFEGLRSEPAAAMQVDEQPAPPTAIGMVNGHKHGGEYTAADVFSGPAVESPQPTNEPTPPSAALPVPAAGHATASASLVGEAVNVMATPSQPQPPHKSPSPPPPTQRPTSKTSTLPSASVITDTPMEDVQLATTKLVREAPTPSSEEPPAKRFKAEPSTPAPTYDTSKKIPANQHKFLTALLRQIRRSKDSMPFREPVDPVKLNIPRYFDIVDRPMDLSTIETKLATGAYPVVRAVVDDFNLMIDNCVKFNGLENPVTKMGRNMQATFEKGMKTLPQEQVG